MYSTCFIWFALICSGRALLVNSPNIILFLTDDQDALLNSMKALRKTQELIVKNGITFENAYVNSPICCPSRSSILTGKYAHNIKVYNNSLNGNCSSAEWQKNYEKYSIASYLKSAKNYTTFYAGKYLNQYGSINSGGLAHIPPGYDWWIGLKGNSKYYNYTLSINGTGRFYVEEYLTDKMKNFAVDFMRLNNDKPFFMTLATPACHAPFTPAKRHSQNFPNEKAVRNPSFNYSSENKHWIVTMPPKYLPTNISRLDLIQKKRLQTLLAVDEMVECLVEELKNLNIYSTTYIIFTSDNGYHIGQFGQPWDKRQPYQTDIKVPLFLSGPGIPKNRISQNLVSAIDIAPTILDLAEVPIPKDMDGISFKNIMLQNIYPRSYILVEYWGEGGLKVNHNCPWTDENLMVKTGNLNYILEFLFYVF